MRKTITAIAGALLTVAAVPASAATIFFSGFENVPGGPTSDGTYTIVANADGWSSTNGIELQRRVAGSPSVDPDGGNVFVELDTTGNSDMFRTIAAGGTYDISFLYSPRPGVPYTSNGISLTVGGSNVVYSLQGNGIGLSDTNWGVYTARFTASAGDVLNFSAFGTSDGLGGYIDNISLAGVPEPATWALMILGFGAIGGAMRRRQKTAVRFA